MPSLQTIYQRAGTWFKNHSDAIRWTIVGLFGIIVMQYGLQIDLWLIAHPPHTWAETLAPLAQDFLTLTCSVIVEATPFLIIGIIVSALIRRFLPPDRLLKILPKHTLIRRILLSLVGIALPVCECGNVPVARSLLAHGLKPADVISFLLAAPILNPITIIATMTAFSFEPRMVWWRIGFGFLIVQLTALIVSFIHPRHVLQPSFAASCTDRHPTTFRHILADSRNEFWQLTTMLVLGAMIAAATQVFVPRSIINAVGGDIILSVIAMIGLGFVVSICSSVDAFFALAYARIFTNGSVLAFLLTGPMIDIKLVLLMRSTFRPRFILLVMLIIFSLSLATGIGVNLYAR